MGGGKKQETVVVQQPPPPPPPPTPKETALQVSEARSVTDPAEAQRSFDILTNPTYGARPTTQFIEGVRSEAFPLEQAIRSQLAANLLANLQSPSGISPEQASAIRARRGEAQTDLTTALRERANLGGNLYGGRAIQRETDALTDLNRAFVEDDIAREERARLNAIQSALPFLSVLFPEVGITPPSFQSAAPSAESALSAALSGRGQDIGYGQGIMNAQLQAQMANQQAALQRQQANSALWSGLFGAAGNAAGGALGYGGRFGQSLR